MRLVFRVLAVAALVFSASRISLAQAPTPPTSRVPNQLGPRWSPAAPCRWLSAGYQTPDSNGNFHGVWERTSLEGGAVVRRLIHVTSEFGLRDDTGNTPLSRGEVVWTYPSDGLGRFMDGKLVAGSDGTLYLFFRASGLDDPTWPARFPTAGVGDDIGETSTSHLYFCMRSPGPTGTWSTPSAVTSTVTPTASSKKALLGVLSYAVSMPPMMEGSPPPAPVCHFERHVITYADAPSAEAEYPVDRVYSVLQSSSGAPTGGAEGGPENEIRDPVTHSDLEKHIGIGAHKGHYVRQIRTFSGATATKRIIVDGSEIPGSAGPDTHLAQPQLALYVDTSEVAHVLYVMAGVAHHYAGGVDDTDASAFAMFQDSNDVLHALGEQHKVFNGGIWSTGEGTSVGVASIGIGVDSLDHIYCLSGELNFIRDVGDPLHPRVTATWEPNLGTQDSLAMASVGPGGAVNLTNGNLHLEIGLFSVAGHGPSVAISLIYNSLEPLDWGLGEGWRHSFSLELHANTLYLPSGERIPFTIPVSGPSDSTIPAGSLRPADEFGASLILRPVSGPGDALYEVESASGIRWRFNKDGNAVQVVDRDGNSLTLTNEDNPLTSRHERQLTKITDAYLRSTEFSYDARNLLTKIKDPGGSEYILVYDEARPLLKTITLPKAPGQPDRNWNFTYFSASDLDPDTGEVTPATDAMIPPDAAPFGGVKDLLWKVRTPCLSLPSDAGIPDSIRDYWFTYYPRGPFRGFVRAGISPSRTLNNPDVPTPDPRNYQLINYEEPVISVSLPGLAPPLDTLTNMGFKTKVKVVDFGSLTATEFEVIGDPVRSVAIKVTDAESHDVIRLFDIRRNVLVARDFGSTSDVPPTVDLDIISTYYVPSTDVAEPPAPPIPADAIAPKDWLIDLPRTVLLPGDSTPTKWIYDPDTFGPTEVTDPTGKVTKYTYDGEGHLTKYKLPGDSLEYLLDYFATGQLLETTSPSGSSSTYSIGSYGLVTGISVDELNDETGASESFGYTYNVMGQVLTEAKPGGGPNTYTYHDETHQVWKLTPPPGPEAVKLEFQYDADGDVTKTVDSDGKGTETIYDEERHVVAVVDPNAKKTKAKWTGGHLAEVTDQAGHKSTYAHDKSGRETSASREMGLTAGTGELKVETKYDAHGNPVERKMTVAEGPCPVQVTKYIYDPATNLLVTKVLEENTEQHFRYDKNRRLVAEMVYWSASGTPAFYSGTQHILDDAGRTLQTIEAAGVIPNDGVFVTGTVTGRVTEFLYDASGRLLQTKSPMGKITKWEYNKADRVTKTTDPTGVETIHVHSPQGPLIGNKIRIPGHGLQMPVRNTYDARGHLASWHDNVNPSAIFENFYDKTDRLTRTTGPDGLEQNFYFDAAGRMTKDSIRRDASTMIDHEFKYDDVGNLTETFAPLVGSETGVVRWLFAYDKGRRRLTTNSPLGYTTDSKYDAAGNLLTYEDEDGNKVTHSYDCRNRLISSKYEKKLPGGGFATWDLVTRTYDGQGRLLSVEGSVTKVKVEYLHASPYPDELQGVNWTVDGVPFRNLVYLYDDDGRLTKTTIVTPGGGAPQEQELSYDDAGRITEMRINGVVQAGFTYKYGFLTETTLGNGNKIKREYDKKGRLQKLTHVKPGGSFLGSVEYTYDDRDRRKTAYYGHLDLLSQFTYNDVSWLTEELHTKGIGGPGYTNDMSSEDGGNEAAPTEKIDATPGTKPIEVIGHFKYEYDNRGNRTWMQFTDLSTATYLYDKNDRLTSETRAGVSISYSYALRGDLVAKTVGGVSTSYQTDHMARITHVTSGTTSEHYRYSPTGERLAKWAGPAGASPVDIPAPPAGATQEWWLPSLGDTIADYTRVGAGPWTFDGAYAGLGLDERVARVSPSGEGQYYFTDALHSVMQVMTGSSGDVTRTNFTDAWGNDLALSPDPLPYVGLATRYGFTGRENDTESGLMHYRARSYDPKTGRFVSRDSAGAGNLYAYAGNSPTNATDPSGQILRFAMHNQSLKHKVAQISALEKWLGLAMVLRPNGVVEVVGARGNPIDQGTLPAETVKMSSSSERFSIESHVVGRITTWGNSEAFHDLVNEEAGEVVSFLGVPWAAPEDNSQGILADTFLNADSMVSAWKFGDFGAQGGMGRKIVAGALLAVLVVDAASNFIPGVGQGKAAIKRGIKEGVEIGAKRAARESVDDLAKGAFHIFKEPGVDGGYLAARSGWLGEESSLAELISRRGVPGTAGVTLTDSTVRFKDLWQLSKRTDGLEIALTRENGKYRVYSGGTGIVGVPHGVRPIAHVQPGGGRFPSQDDIDSLTALWDLMKKHNPRARRPRSQVIWGPEPGNATPFGPGE